RLRDLRGAGGEDRGPGRSHQGPEPDDQREQPHPARREETHRDGQRRQVPLDGAAVRQVQAGGAHLHSGEHAQGEDRARRWGAEDRLPEGPRQAGRDGSDHHQDRGAPMTSPPLEVPEDQLRIPKELPILPLRDIVVYPFIIVPLSVSRERSIKAVDQALAENRMILLVSQKDSQVEEPNEKDLFNVGTVGVIMRMLKLPDGRIRVLMQGVCRARVDEFVRGESFTTARLTRIVEPAVKPAMEQEAMMRTVKKSLEK